MFGVVSFVALKNYNM